MELNDITRKSALKKLNKLIENRYGINLSINKLTPAKTAELVAKLDEQIADFKLSSLSQSAAQHPVYMKMVMIRESLTASMKDYKPANAPGSKAAPKLTAVSTSKQAIKEMSSGRNFALILKALRYANEGREIPNKCMEGFLPLVKHLSSLKLNEDALAKSEVILAARNMVDTLQGMVEDLSKMINEEMSPLLDSIRDQIGAAQAQEFGVASTQTLNAALESIRSAREQVDSSVRALTGEQTLAPQTAGEPVAPEITDADLDSAELDSAEDDGFGAASVATGGTSKLGREAR